MLHFQSKAKKALQILLCSLIAFTLSLQLPAVSVHAEVQEAKAYTPESLKEEFSRNGNPVSQYENPDDGKLKTIIWAKGITPPVMGGENSDFQRRELEINGALTYVEYIAPYVKGNGWFDINKTEDREPDLNLCFAAAASNTLHWWLTQNTEYIDRFLAENPDYDKANKLNGLRNPAQDQQGSPVYQIFLDQFANRQEGYWPDILQDQFINGYYPKPNGGTNDSDQDRENLLTKGPDPHGGFFFDVFKTSVLTQRRTYAWGYSAISNDIKEHFLKGDIILLSYTMGGTLSHVVTLWGAEYDLNGNISAVYLTDSDDLSTQGMMRYRIVDFGGAGILSTRLDGKGSLIESLQILSPGKQYWDSYFGITQLPLTLQWSNTTVSYNGMPQKPTVTASGIQAGDRVSVTAEVTAADAGTYTAHAVLSGADAEKYSLPENNSVRFTIKQIPASVSLSVDMPEQSGGNTALLNAKVSGLPGELPTGTVRFKDGSLLLGEAPLSEGSASFTWTAPRPGTHSLTAEYLPESTGAGKNYLSAESSPVQVSFNKNQQDPLVLDPISGKRFLDPPFELSVTGGSGTGLVTYSSSNPQVISVEGSRATIKGAGETVITALKQGDDEYNSTWVQLPVTVGKADAPTLVYPMASSLVYGQKLKESTLTGGSTQYGDFAWENGDSVPSCTVTQALVQFTPNAETLRNYAEITPTSAPVDIQISRAAPEISVTASFSGRLKTPDCILSATVTGKGLGDSPSGEVRFYDCTSGTDKEIGSASLKNGGAALVWTDAANQLYRVKAVYSGDTNYTEISGAEVEADFRRNFLITVESGEHGRAHASHLEASAGTTVTLTAEPDKGYRLKNWEVLSGEIKIADNRFTMPETAVSIKANFELEKTTGGGGRPGGGGGGGGGRPSGGGISGGGGGSVSGNTTETTTLDDGTIIQTTKKADGTKQITWTKKDGSTSFTHVTAAGKTKTRVTLKDAANQGQGTSRSISLPMYPVVPEGEAPPSVEIETGTDFPVTVRIPIDPLSPGTVAAEIKADGSREIIRKSAFSETELILQVADGTVIEITENEKPFRDIQNHWGRDAIVFVTARNLYAGTAEDVFSPDLGMTRGMLVKVLHNLENNPDAGKTLSFTDVSQDDWYAQAVSWAVEKEIVKGYSPELFGPEDPITREQLAAILYRLSGSPATSDSAPSFADGEEIGGFAKPAVIWAADAGIINGVGENRFSPQGTATRGEAAAMLMRWMNRMFRSSALPMP